MGTINGSPSCVPPFRRTEASLRPRWCCDGARVGISKSLRATPNWGWMSTDMKMFLVWGMTVPQYNVRGEKNKDKERPEPRAFIVHGHEAPVRGVQGRPGRQFVAIGDALGSRHGPTG